MEFHRLPTNHNKDYSSTPKGDCAKNDFDAVMLGRLHHIENVRTSVVRDDEPVRRCYARLPARIDVVGSDEDVDRLLMKCDHIGAVTQRNAT